MIFFGLVVREESESILWVVRILEINHVVNKLCHENNF